MIYLFLKLIFAALLGLGIKLANKAKTLNERASITGYAYNTATFLKDERFVILGSILTIALILLIASPIINPDALIPNDTPFNVWIFQFYRRSILEVILFLCLSFGGWAGMEAALRWFGVADKRWNKALDDSTTLAQEAKGTLGQKEQLPTIKEIKEANKAI